MAERPAQPEHFSSPAPPRAPRARLNVAAGVVAALFVAGVLVGTFLAQRSEAPFPVRPDPQSAARRAAAIAQQSEMRRISRQVSTLRKRMHAIAVEAGVVSAAPPGDPDAGAPP